MKKKKNFIFEHFWEGSKEEQKIREYFRELDPTGNAEKQSKDYGRAECDRIKKLGIFFVAATIVLSLAIKEEPKLFNGNELARNDVGNGDYTAELIAEVGEDEIPYTIEVKERVLSEEEAENLFNSAEQELARELLGENTSLDHITYDLNLPKTAQDGLVNIEWKFDDYQVISTEGVLKDTVEEGEKVPLTITAEMTYADYSHTAVWKAIVEEKTLSYSDKVEKAINKAIDRAEQDTAQEENLILPEESSVGVIQWKEKTANKTAEILLLLLGICMWIFFHERQQLKEKCKIRKKELIQDYPQVVNELTLLIGAGMTIQTAWNRMTEHYEKRREKGRRYAYEEMLATRTQLTKGISEAAALENYGKRCGQLCYMKFTGLLIQNIHKGNKGLDTLLENEVRQAFEDRKAAAKQMGEEASTKMLLPLGILLVIVMIIVILPGLWSM